MAPLQNPFGLLVLISGFVFAPIFGQEWALALFLIGAFLIFAVFLMQGGSKHQLTAPQSETMEERFRRDPRAPVLYLRPFVRDKEAAKIATMRQEISHIMQYGIIQKAGMEKAPIGDKAPIGSEEQHLVRVFEHVGPVVAIGDPSDLSPPAGAVRSYIVEEEWKDVIADLMERATMVVLHLGPSEGLLWEFETAVNRVSPDRLLLIVPDYVAYNLFVMMAKQRHRFVFKFPDYDGKGDIIPTSIKGFIWFNRNWIPHFTRMPWRLRDLFIADGDEYLGSMLGEVLSSFLSQVERTRRVGSHRSTVDLRSDEMLQ
jgi:hypothetical protein